MPPPDPPRVPTVLRHSYEVSEVYIRRPTGDRIENFMVWRSSWIVPRTVTTTAELRRIIDARAYPDYFVLVGAFTSEVAAMVAIRNDTLLLKQSEAAR